MRHCQWSPCEERATINVKSLGVLVRDDDLCVEHASRERDNLLAAGCTVFTSVLRIKCDYEHELWGPHEGCREFMDGPEAIIPCNNDATRVFHVTDHTPFGDEDEDVYACDEHDITDDMYCTVRAVGLVPAQHV